MKDGGVVAGGGGGVRQSADDMQTLEVSDFEAIQEIPGVAAASPSVSTGGQPVNGNNNYPSQIYGVTPECLDIRKFKVEAIIISVSGGILGVLLGVVATWLVKLQKDEYVYNGSGIVPPAQPVIICLLVRPYCTSQLKSWDLFYYCYFIIKLRELYFPIADYGR